MTLIKTDRLIVRQGDCLEVMRKRLSDNSIDAIVCDPPYGLGFMGKEWDALPPGLEWAQECYRVLKPGGHLLAFGGTRTWHRLAVAVEDAGFEIRDSIAWLYGSGFPKSLNLGDGRGTALKPAFEPIVMGRKPLIGTVAVNVLAHGTGALNINACRIASTDSQLADKYASVQNAGARANSIYGSDARDRAGAAPHEAGRWPANVVLDEAMADVLDEQSGASVSRIGKPRGAESGDGWGMSATGAEYADTGGASRFFYVAKAPTKERPKVWLKSCNCETVKPCQSQLRDTTESKSADATSWSTSTSGNRQTDQSQPDTISTIEMATNSTTNSPISSLSPNLSTNASILDVNCGMESGGNLAESATNSNEFPRPIGTSVQRDGLSMVAADPATLHGWSATSVCANCGKPAQSLSHATVKPLALMRWLVRLVTPPDGLILDPFLGSGTTAQAALDEGFRCYGIERDETYFALIRQRLGLHEPPID